MSILEIAKESLTQIVKRDDWTGGECRNYAQKALAKIALEGNHDRCYTFLVEIVD